MPPKLARTPGDRSATGGYPIPSGWRCCCWQEPGDGTRIRQRLSMLSLSPSKSPRLADLGMTVLLETSGAHDIGRVDPRVHIIMDLKCPDSGECEGNRWANLSVLKPADQIKFIIASRRDFDWAVDTIRTHDLQSR